jgi:hypothetical protein
VPGAAELKAARGPKVEETEAIRDGSGRLVAQAFGRDVMRKEWCAEEHDRESRVITRVLS